MNKLLILISYTKFELNSLRNNEITDYRHFWTKQKSEMTSYLNSGYDVIHYFAKFKKFLPHSIIPSFDCRKSNGGQKSICIYQDCRNKGFIFTIKMVWDQVSLRFRLHTS